MASFEMLRFPIIFGGLLIAATTAYVFRDQLKPDLEEDRNRLFRGDEESRRIIAETIKSFKK